MHSFSGLDGPFEDCSEKEDWLVVKMLKGMVITEVWLKEHGIANPIAFMDSLSTKPRTGLVQLKDGTTCQGWAIP